MKPHRAITVVIHAPTEQEARELVPPLRTGWTRQESVDLHCSCVSWPVRIQVVDTEANK